jgi:hypothetical protein
MPIDKAQIPAMVKRVDNQRVPDWKKEYFARTAKNLQVHTKGHLFDKVDTLFPNESPDSKEHCMKSYEPITRGSIWKGINNLKRIFLHSSFSFTVGDALGDWLKDYTWKGQTLQHYFLELWVSKAVAEDPNGMFVVYPPEWAEERNMCPVQFVRTELFRTVDENFFAFASEQDSEIKYDYNLTVMKREVFEDASIQALNARTCAQYTYNRVLSLKVVKEVVHVFTPDGILMYEKDGATLNWTAIDFPAPVPMLPVFTGGGKVVDEADQPLYESFVGDFVPFGNLALLQHRNHRAVDLQYSYPRMSELEIPCDYAGCTAGQVSCIKSTEYPRGLMPCPKCRGGGFITPQSPYKVYKVRYDQNDQANNEHLKHDPVKYFSPPTGIIEYSKEAWKDYLKLAEVAIFVQQQVYTGQVESAESKDKNFEDMFAWLTGVSRMFYQSNLRAFLQSLENYMNPSPVTVTVEQPYSMAVLTESEAFEALTKIMGSQAPHFIKANRVEGFISKFVSKDAPLQQAIKVLKRYDRLLFYTQSEIQGFRGANAISPEMITRHALAYPTLMMFLQVDPALFQKSEEEIIRMLDEQIKLDIPEAPAEDMRRKLLEDMAGGGAGA